MGWLHVTLILLDFCDFAKTSPMANTPWTIFATSEIFANTEFLHFCFNVSPKLRHQRTLPVAFSLSTDYRIVDTSELATILIWLTDKVQKPVNWYKPVAYYPFRQRFFNHGLMFSLKSKIVQLK